MKKKYIFEVYETGYERHTGEFQDVHLLTDKLQNAIEKYNSLLNYVKHNKDFYLSQELYKAEESTHTPSAYNYSLILPIFEIPAKDGDEWYELSIRCVEVELNDEDKKYAILINRESYSEDNELISWVDYHNQLFSTIEDAKSNLDKLIQDEFKGLCADRENNTDYHLDKDENTIYDSEPGYNIPVAHYYIVVFNT